MCNAYRRPVGRLCYWVLTLVMVGASAFGVDAVPATTTVSDTVHMADGSAAQGNLIITWPAFVTADGAAVAAGMTTAALGDGGALSIALVPNAGATPAGVYYTVVYQLGPGQVKTEYWVVPGTSPANLATVRTTPGSGLAAQPVSMQYVNSELATKANDTAVVHLNGSEVISGAKTFATSPSVPAPMGSSDIATKSYVDDSLANVGAGNYLPTAGGTMTGPITLPGDPASPLHATPKQYVDMGMSGKADVIAGVVPATELGTGPANAGACLVASGSSSASWSACGGGSGSGNVSTTPTGNQNVSQPAGTAFSTNNLANVRYVTAAWNWVQRPSDSLAAAGSNTIHLSPCPMGIDTSNGTNRPYYVYVAGTGTPEIAQVTGGTCPSGAASGTITITTTASHANGYTVGSSTSGIQEAINDAGNLGAGVVIPPTGASANALPVYSTIYMQAGRSWLRGEGKPTLACKTRSVCLFIGDRFVSTNYMGIEVSGIRFASGNNFSGIQATSMSCAASVASIAMNNTGANAIQAGDWFDVSVLGNPQHFIGLHQATSGTNGSQVTYAETNCGGAGTIAAIPAYGGVSLENAAIEDNANATSVHDVYFADVNGTVGWGRFQNQIVVDNDQAFKLDEMNVDTGANCNSIYCGQSVYFPGPFSKNAAVGWLSNMNLSLNCSGNGVTAWNGNTIHISNSVIQGFNQWGVYDGTLRGGYGGGLFNDVYEEVGGCTNPAYSPAMQGMAGLLNSGNSNTIHGGEFPVGQMPRFAALGNQATTYQYAVVIHDSTNGYSRPLKAGWATVDNTAPSGNIVVQWPRVQGTGTVTYDVLRYTAGAGGLIEPYTNGCGGGSTTACGAVATGVAQCSALTCSFTDNASASTAAYTVRAPQYQPGLTFWPGGIVSVLGYDYSNSWVTNPTFLDDNDVVTPLSPIVTESGLMMPQVFSERCSNANGGEWLSCLAGNSFGNNGMPSATLMQYGMASGGAWANLKGRLNFFGSQLSSINSGEIITLVDSNPAKTLATPGFRPTQDASDTYLGTDTGSVSYPSVGLAIGAPASISSYINSTPNGTNFLERLTASGKTFNVPVTVNGNLAVSSGNVTLPITGSGSQCLHVSATGVVSGTGSDCGSGGGSGGVNSGNAHQVAMYSADGTAVSGDSALMDDGTTLNYSGPGGITASSGTFSGNLTINGALQVSGPWMVSSPIPGVGMLSAGTGMSSLGISNDGNFYISTNGGSPQRIATAGTSSYFANLSQEDANSLGQYNGTNPQTLRVYSSYTGPSTWQRTSMGFDAADNLAVLRSENSTSSSAPGLGFWIGSSVRWAIDSTSTLKPFANNSINLGTPTLAPQTIYAATSFDTLTQGKMNFELCNDPTTGTALNFLAKYNGASPACAVNAAGNDTDGIIGVVSNGSGTSGNAVITYRGFVLCSFDGATTAGDYVVASATNPGDCHDAGASRPTGVQALGRVETTNAAGGTYGMRASLDSPVSTGLANSTAIPWIPTPHYSSGINFSTTANKAIFTGVILTFAKTTSQVTYLVQGADNTANVYDIGIYSGTAGGTCTQVAHTGPTAGTAFAPTASTWKTMSWSGGPVTLLPGRYYLAYTTSCTSSCATMGGDITGMTFAGSSGGANSNVSVSSGGTLPATVSCPVDSYATTSMPNWAVN